MSGGHCHHSHGHNHHANCQNHGTHGCEHDSLGRQPLWQVLLCSSLVLLPSFLGAVIPKSWSARFEKQLMGLALGSMLGFVFGEGIPHVVEHIHLVTVGERHLAVSFAVFAGIMFAVGLSLLHSIGDFIGHSLLSQSHSEKGTVQHSSKLEDEPKLGFVGDWLREIRRLITDTPAKVWVIVVGEVVHNLVDGAMIAVSPTVGTTAGLLMHEVTHSISDFGLFIGLGMGKRRAVMLRVLSNLPIFVGSMVVWSIPKLNRNQTMNVLSHAIVSGIFLYMALVDVLPVIVPGIVGHSHAGGECAHHHGGHPPTEGSSKIEMAVTVQPTQKCESEQHCDHHHHGHDHCDRSAWIQSGTTFVCFAVSFTVTVLCNVYLDPCGKSH